MSSPSASKLARPGRRAILPDDPGEPGRVVAEAEARAAKGRREKWNAGGGGGRGSRARAQELHREADQLYYKGDYESALVLYHRASRLCPREAVHGVAARRTEAVISSAAEPSPGRMLRPRMPRSVESCRAKVEVAMCPEVAATRAREIVESSEDPDRDVPGILRYFDARRDYWRLPSPGASPRLGSRSRATLRQLSKCVKSTMREVESAHEAGDSLAVHRLSEELVDLAALGDEPHRTQLEVCGYLALKQTELGRHDRAAHLAARMIFLARTCGDKVAMVEALLTLGKVHVKFGHLDALVRVWERLVDEIQTESIPQAWLHHDIGRCHLELGNFPRALASGRLCLECARSARSRKWTARGQLLSAQSLLKLGRPAEAVAALKVAAAEATDEPSILLYAQSLMDQVTSLLRRLNREREGRVEPRETRSRTRRNSIGGASGARREDEGNAEVELTRENLEQQDEPRSAKEESSAEDKKIALLLARTRALRRVQSPSTAPGDKSVEVPRLTAAALSAGATEVGNVGTDSSRTRVIRRADGSEEEDERTLGPNELTPLSDLSGAEDAGEEDFASARIDEEEGSEVEEDAEAVVQSRTAVAAAAAASVPTRTAATVAPEEEEAEEEQASVDEEIPVSYFSPNDDQLTSRSFSFSLFSETELLETSLASSSALKDENLLDTPGLSAYLRSLESREFLRQERPFLEARSGAPGPL